ncbi:MAG: phage tail tape measure protein, partial [Planctomycetia bacterium]|nr:phage tail tape measure protein [Planctomycetia bacterium]
MASANTITAGKAYVIISAIDRTKHILATVTKNVDAAARKIQTIGTQLMMGAGFAGLGAALPIQQFARFEDAMLAVRAKMQASEEDYKKLSALAQHYGETTSYTAQQVADAMVVMAQAGLKAPDVEKSIGPVLNAARATGTELASMTDYILSAIRTMGGSFDEMGMYADVMTAACNNSALNMDMLGESLIYCAKPAQVVGVNIKELTALIGFLANQGIRGSQTGTALRRMFTSLATQKNKLMAVGIDPFNEFGKLRNINGIIADMRRVTSTMKDVEKISFVKSIFGQYALAPMLALLSDEYTEISEAIENSAGVAARTAEMMDSSIGGTFRMIMSAVEGVGNAIGESFKNAINGARNGIISYVQSVTEWIKTNRETVVMTAAGIAAIGTLGATLLVVGTALRVASFALSGFGFVLATVGLIAKGVGLIFALFGGLAAIIPGAYLLTATAIAGIAVCFGPELLAAAQASWEGIKSGFSALIQWFGRSFPTASFYISETCKNMGTTLYGVATDIGTAFSTAWQGISAAGSQLWGSLKTDCSAAFSAISSQITNGDWTGAFETAVLAMRAVWSDFQRFFVTAWHSTALAFMDIWQSMRRGIQDARESIAKLVGWFMKIGMTDAEKVEFDKALVDVQAADRNSMEQGFTASQKRHEEAIAKAEVSNVSIREELTKHTKEVQDKAHEQAAADEFSRYMEEQKSQYGEEEAIVATMNAPENFALTPVELPELASQILSGAGVTAHILEAVQGGTVAAEKNFLENKAALKNAEIEKAEKAKKDENGERTAN